MVKATFLSLSVVNFYQTSEKTVLWVLYGADYPAMSFVFFCWLIQSSASPQGSPPPTQQRKIQLQILLSWVINCLVWCNLFCDPIESLSIMILIFCVWSHLWSNFPYYTQTMENTPIYNSHSASKFIIQIIKKWIEIWKEVDRNMERSG